MIIRRNYRQLVKRLIPVFVLTIISIALVVFLTNKTTSSTEADTSDAKVYSVTEPLQSSEINREFSFPIGDFIEPDSNSFIYVIEKAEVRDQIVVQGSPATAIAGRAFLVINLRLTNDLDDPIEINTRDYIRLGIGDAHEKLAADVHNDPVIIQPISTKNTRIAFPINKSDIGALKLYVGEIKGNKETITILF